MKTRFFTLFLAVMASVVTMRAEVLSGTCGEHLTWSLDTEDSTLTISGTGAMTNYSTSSLAPWIAHKDCIKSVVMEEGVTSIGEFAFYTCQGLNSVIFSHSITSIEWGAFTACTGLTSVIIGDAVTSIGAYAFDGCFNLTSVTISNSVTSIQGEAFWYCTNLKSISIGSAVTSISFLSFAYCTNLTSITCAAVTPPTCQTNTFNEVSKSIPLYVPSQSIPAYQAAEGWSEFTNILPIQGTEPCLLASGYCGADGDSTNLTWELSCDSILTITGAGKMADYASYSAPWRSYGTSSQIKRVIISEGVTSVGSYAFYQAFGLDSVYLPNTITRLGSLAFALSGITSIQLPDSITTLGNGAFSGCAITSISIPSSLHTISSGAFSGCALSSLTIPNTVTAIENSAFSFGEEVTEVFVPASVIYIGESAFSGSRLRDIHVDEANPTYSSADGVLFNKNKTVLLLYSRQREETEYVVPGSVTQIGERAFVNCNNLKNIIIPNSVTKLAAISLYGCALDSIIIPSSVTYIGDQAFFSCNQSRKLYISKNVTYIGSDAFSNCSSLGVIICDAIEPPTLGGNGLNSFNSVDKAIPLYVPSISYSAYKSAKGWDRFTNIRPILDSCLIASGTCGTEGDNLTWKLSCDGMLAIEGTGDMATYMDSTAVPWFDYRRTDIRNIYIGDEVTSIGVQAFMGCALVNEMYIPTSVTSIGDYAFAMCSSLRTITIPETVTHIGSHVFSGCDNLPVFGGLRYADQYMAGIASYYLNSYEIKDGTRWIGDWAFYGNSLTSVIIPKSVKYIGDYAFGNCSQLETVYNLATTPQVISSRVFENSMHVGDTLYVPHQALEQYQSTDGWKEFANILPITYSPSDCVMASGYCGAAEDSTTMRWTLYCDSVLVISGAGKMADYSSSSSKRAPWYNYYSKIVEIYLPDSLENIGKNAFYNCRHVESLYIPNNVMTIGDMAFNGCSELSSVMIPNSVRTIGSRVFQSCTSLQSIIVDSNNPVYDSRDNCNAIIETATNTLCVGTLHSTIPNSVTKIGDYAFYYCNLDSLYIPDSVTSIGKYAFSHCKELISVIIGNGVTTIGQRAFDECSSLTTITLGAGVTTIERDAFSHSSTINTIVCYAIIPPSLQNEKVFSNIDKAICVLYVPYSSIAYQTAEGWSEFTNILPIEEPVDPPCLIASGYCGAEGDSTKLRWELSCDSVLTISGTGDIMNRAWTGYRNGIKSVIMHEGVTGIGKDVFREHKTLEQVTIPNSVLTINEYAFKNCVALTSLVIPSNVYYIGNDAFRYCKQLTSITCEALTPPSLGTSVFGNVPTSIPLYVPYESIAAYQTANIWKSFTNILPIPGTGPCLLASGFCGADSLGTNLRWELSCDSVLTINGTGEMYDYRDTMQVPWHAYRTQIRRVQMDNFTSIGSYAFYRFTNLESVVLPDSLQSIGRSAFEDSRVSSIAIPDGVRYIGDFAFNSCWKLDSLTVGRNVESIGYLAFGYPDNLKYFEWDAVDCNADTVFYVTEDMSEGIDYDQMFRMGAVKEIVFGDGVRRIPAGLCSRMGDNYTSIRVVLPDSLQSIGRSAFEDSRVSSITIPDGVRYIGDYAFNSCWKLDSLTVGRNVESIGYLAFGYPDNLKYFEWDAVDCNADTVFYVTEDMSEGIDYDQMFRMGAVKEIVFGDGVRRIPAGLCSRMGDNYTSIRVVLPDSLQSIGRSAFEDSRVSSIAIPDGVRYIGDYAFNNCWTLKDITLEPMTPPTISGDSTYIFPNSTTIYVECPAVKAYRTAWPSYAHQIQSIGKEVKETFKARICYGDSVFFGGRSISQSGIYADTLVAYTGCDSIIELQLYVAPSYYFYDTISMNEGESYNWHGQTITTGGEHTQYYASSMDCDSVYVLFVNLIKMCSWKVESKDIVMGVVSTAFQANKYPYGTQLKVEALPNSGYKFVKWNDGKKYNPYTFTILDDKYLMAIFMEEEVEPDTTIVVPTVSTVTVTWPAVEDSYRYSLTIYLDEECTIPFCTVTFDAAGHVLDISFAQYGPRRVRKQDIGFTYTVPGLDANTKYYYRMEATDEDGKLLNTDEGDFQTKAGVPTSLDETETVIEPMKILHNGHVYILRADKVYTVTGVEVK